MSKSSTIYLLVVALLKECLWAADIQSIVEGEKKTFNTESNLTITITRCPCQTKLFNHLHVYIFNKEERIEKIKIKLEDLVDEAE